MSRIGKAPIAVPEGVTVTIDGASIKVKGPKGELEQTIDPEIGVELNDNVLTGSDVDGSMCGRMLLVKIFWAKKENPLRNDSDGFRKILIQQVASPKL